MNTSKPIRPMKAAETPENIDDLQPHIHNLYGSPKFDGIRALCGVLDEKGVYSTTLKKIPSSFVQSTFGHPRLNGIDGELMVGVPGPTCFSKSYSAVMTHGADIPVALYAFDLWNKGDVPYIDRLAELTRRVADWQQDTGYDYIKVVPQIKLTDLDHMLEYEQNCLAQGYEGAMVRRGDAKYKWGRSTLREGGLIKLKRFTDSEAIIVGMEELLHNDNELVVDIRGLAKRSTHIANKTAAGTLGALLVRDIKSGQMFKVGTGFTADVRSIIWNNQDRYLEDDNLLVKYKYLPYGVKDAPRHPVFLGFRHKDDM